MYGPILKNLRESQERTQAEVARSVGISPAQLARLESNQRGLYVDDFVRIAAALGEKAGNLLPNDLGEIGHLKPFIDRLASVRPDLLPRVMDLVEHLVLLAEDAAVPMKKKRKQG
jgi:transcriptional regulator with XRE-family HTH domain